MLGKRTARYLVVLVTTALAACSSIGPGTMDRDQLDYGQSLGDNWKNQMLANIVKLRYADMPVFIDVGSIVSGYSFETQVNANAGFGNSFTGEDSQLIGAGGRYTDRPTITYVPKTGDSYLRSLLTPVEPRNLLALIHSGYNVELLFNWAVEAVNGVSNFSATATRGKLTADREFFEVSSLMRELQIEEITAWKFQTDVETGDDVILVIRSDDATPDLEAKRRRVGEILRLEPTLDRYRVVYAPIHIGGDTLAIQTRSVAQMLGAMAGFVDVPPELTAEAIPGFTAGSGIEQPFRVHSGPDKPDNTYATIKYNDYWYWIDPTDIASKRVFVMMLFLTTLTSTSEGGRGPVLTIPTG